MQTEPLPVVKEESKVFHRSLDTDAIDVNIVHQDAGPGRRCVASISREDFVTNYILGQDTGRHVKRFGLLRATVMFCTANNITDKTDESGERRRTILLTSFTEDANRKDFIFNKVVKDANFQQYRSPSGEKERCGFKSELDVALRDRFVLGLENVKEKEKVVAERVAKLTLVRAFDLAQSVQVVRLAVQNAMFESAAKTAGSGGGSVYDSSHKCSVCGY
ncbi:hypothetical protein EVAR_97997_1 [Eumeta japonica]|uniref:Uncharacterized protein n=1 Tax=Eumeta variegata TaxID=151549 RepID=A0A4C1WJI0_EUMVA|nr:hypothetical protein EVAR_97997_1 [Eumeta japonica]